MTFRVRVTLAAAFAVLVAVLLTSATVFLIVHYALRRQIDQSLRQSLGQSPTAVAARLAAADPSTATSMPDRFVQLVTAEGMVFPRNLGNRALPITETVLAVARGAHGAALFDGTVDSTPVRVYAVPVGDDRAIVFGRSLSEVDETLGRLGVALVVVSATGVGLAALVGHLVASAAVAPVQRLSQATDLIAETGDFSQRVGAAGNDELGRLAAGFNAMLETLEASLERERRLVADASHELRTPIASIRTNVEVLRRAEDLDDEARRELVADVVEQVGELSDLVTNLMELARGDGIEEPFVTFDLAAIAEEAVARTRARHPGIDFRIEATPTSVRGVPSRVTGAVANLLDNATKWSTPPGPVEIVVRTGTVSVRDHGPGIAVQDLGRVFDRFYRAPAARNMTGAGLGLAIVKQVAESHGGTVEAVTEPGGGARFTLRLPSA